MLRLITMAADNITNLHSNPSPSRSFNIRPTNLATTHSRQLRAKVAGFNRCRYRSEDTTWQWILTMVDMLVAGWTFQRLIMVDDTGMMSRRVLPRVINFVTPPRTKHQKTIRASHARNQGHSMRDSTDCAVLNTFLNFMFFFFFSLGHDSYNHLSSLTTCPLRPTFLLTII